MRLRWRALLAAALLGAPAFASAQLGCWVTMGNINFGTVNAVGGGAASVVGLMGVNCSGASTANVRVCIALGSPVDGTWDPRYLAGPGAQRLAYNIYSDPTHTQIWGSAFSTSGLPVAVDIPINYGSGSRNVTYYARVPVQNDVPPGNYTATYTYANDAAVRAAGYNAAPPQCTSSMPIVSRFEFSVTATVIADCAVTATTLDFGNVGIGLAATPVNATSTISMTCGTGVNYSIALNAGTGSGATVAQRKVTRSSGGQTMNYRLYRNAGRTALWGDGSGGTSTLTGTGAGINTPTNHTVYGTLPAQALPPVGAYADTVTVTVTY